MTADRDVVTPGGRSYGFLYLLTNPLMPGLVKVGQTERHPQVRAEELSSHSGIPEPFDLEYFFEVTDRVTAERVVMTAFERYRVSSDREFFRLSVEDARSLLERVASDYLTGLGNAQSRARRYVSRPQDPTTESSGAAYCRECHQLKERCKC